MGKPTTCLLVMAFCSIMKVKEEAKRLLHEKLPDQWQRYILVKWNVLSWEIWILEEIGDMPKITLKPCGTCYKWTSLTILSLPQGSCIVFANSLKNHSHLLAKKSFGKAKEIMKLAKKKALKLFGSKSIPSIIVRLKWNNLWVMPPKPKVHLDGLQKCLLMNWLMI